MSPNTTACTTSAVITKSIRIALPVLITLIFTSSVAHSSTTPEDEIPTRSRTISYASSNLPVTSEQLKLTKSDTNPVLVKSGFRTEAALSEKHASQNIDSYNFTNDFSIYDASSTLITDLDYDGFYHHFKINFDADTVYNSAYVYARLYLSYEGGPWNYYARSGAYFIYGDSTTDSIVIETELTTGYPPGYYDVRIELYDANNHEWLSSYGPHDNFSLSALPLEDDYYDSEYTDTPHYIGTEFVVVGSGAISYWIFFIPISVILIRRFGRQKVRS